MLVELFFVNKGFIMLLFSEKSGKAKQGKLAPWHWWKEEAHTDILLGKPKRQEATATVVKSLSLQWQRGFRVAVAR